MEEIKKAVLMLVESSLAQASGSGRPGLVFGDGNGEARADLD